MTHIGDLIIFLRSHLIKITALKPRREKFGKNDEMTVITPLAQKNYKVLQ